MERRVHPHGKGAVRSWSRSFRAGAGCMRSGSARGRVLPLRIPGVEMLRMGRSRTGFALWLRPAKEWWVSLHAWMICADGSRARTQIQVVILLLPGISAAANFIAVITGITAIAIIRALRVGPGQSLVCVQKSATCIGFRWKAMTCLRQQLVCCAEFLEFFCRLLLCGLPKVLVRMPCRSHHLDAEQTRQQITKLRSTLCAVHRNEQCALCEVKI